MKISQPDIKVKCNLSNLQTLAGYLTELIKNHDEYLKGFVYNSTIRRLYRHQLSTLFEKVAKLIFHNINLPAKKLSLKINESERMVLVSVSAYYPLPLDINFIEYEIKNGLLK